MKWEYKTWIYATKNQTTRITKCLNNIGEAGWEMTSSVPDDKGYVRCFFKREAAEIQH